MEDIELNLDEINALPPEEKAERLLEIAQQATAKANETSKRISQLESAQEQGVQKLLDDQKYQNLMRTESKKLGQDADYIVELVNRDAKLAQSVLDEYFDGMSIADALAQANPQKISEYRASEDDKKVDNKIAEAIAKQNVEATIKNFVSKANLSPEDKATFDKEFADLTEGKKLSEANIDKYLRLAFKEALPDVNIKKIETDAFDMAVGQGLSAQKSAPNNTRSSNIAYLKSVGIIR